ncbi:hypothetical protein FB451DRAFT_1171675 [Mycena latifolia]|nr:hypothetical protein FB451DRAFT_1171675 [Mycena latifolia]
MSKSKSSSASMTGFAFVRNPRQLGKSKTWLLYGHMYLGVDSDGDQTGITLLLRYFNDENYYFGEIGLDFIRGSISQMKPQYELGIGGLARSEYSFVVDVHELVPLHETRWEKETSDDQTTDSQVSDKDNTEPVPVIRLPEINTSIPPYVTIAGLPFNIVDVAATFDIDAETYTQFAKAYGPFPVSCWIIDSPRWTSKPIPFPNKYVKVAGYLKGLQDYDDIKGSPYTKQFKVNIDSVTFLGMAPKTFQSSTPATPGPSQASSQTSAAKRSQNFSGGTPAWLTKKKKGNDGKAAPSSSPSSSS